MSFKDVPGVLKHRINQNYAIFQNVSTGLEICK